MDGFDLKGKKLELNKHEKKDKREAQTAAKFNNLFVKNLPKGTDDNALSTMFSQFGEIESVVVQKDEAGNFKDYGYVCFKESEHAEKAMLEMDKKVLPDQTFLIVNKHISKKDNELVHG